jgi:hypothetical protein
VPTAFQNTPTALDDACTPGDLLVVYSPGKCSGQYVVADLPTRTVLLGPFFSIPHAPIVAQNIADQSNRRVWQETLDAEGRLVCRVLFSPRRWPSGKPLSN